MPCREFDRSYPSAGLAPKIVVEKRLSSFLPQPTPHFASSPVLCHRALLRPGGWLKECLVLSCFFFLFFFFLFLSPSPLLSKPSGSGSIQNVDHTPRPLSSSVWACSPACILHI